MKLLDEIFKPNIEKLEMNKDVHGLIKALRNTWYRVREDAAEALLKIVDPTALKPLISALKDGDDEMRRNVAEALRMIQAPLSKRL